MTAKIVNDSKAKYSFGIHEGELFLKLVLDPLRVSTSPSEILSSPMRIASASKNVSDISIPIHTG